MKEFEKFEEDVRSILVLKGYDHVEKESIHGHKKIDGYFETRFMGKIEKIAVECKDYSRKLTEDQVAGICSTYQPLIDSGIIDSLLIVTRAGIHPSAVTHIKLRRGYFHQTLDELEETTIDFAEYISAVEEEIKSEEVSKYFIEPIGIRKENSRVFDYRSGESLTQHICNKLLLGKNPMAVLGAYGIGKTTLAKAIFLMLCKKRRLGESINPIFIPLSKLNGEQNMEGLLGRLFTYEYNAPGYNYSRFSRLNSRGKIILIMDGFDEMRHMLRWDEFKFNIDEVKKLIKNNAKALFLGRPTAFSSREEYDYVIHAKEDRKILLSGDNVSFDEYEISTFDNEQIRQMASKYYDIFPISDEKREKTISLLCDDEQERINDLAKRPIQLMMLLKVLPEAKSDMSKMTVWLLYSIFLDTLIDRELLNPSRKMFGRKDRRRFSQIIACWLWGKTGESLVSALEIPEEVVNLFTRKGEDPEAVRRDLVTSCFLTTHGGESLHFPHRSIQEFLVAEFYYEYAIIKRRDRRFTPPTWLFELQLNEEIVELICPILEYKQFGRFLELYFRGSKTAKESILERFAKDGNIIDHCLKLLVEAEQDAVPIILLIGGILSENGKNSNVGIDKEEIKTEILKAITKSALGYEKNFISENSRYRYLRYGALCCVTGLVLSAYGQERPGYVERIIEGFAGFYGHKNKRVEKFIGKRHTSKLVRVVHYETNVISVLKAIASMAGKPVHVSKIIDAFDPVLRGAMVVDEWGEYGGIRKHTMENDKEVELEKAWASHLIR